jgi:cytochrome P450
MSTAGASSAADTIELVAYREVHDAFRARDLRQALYDEGAVVMADSLLTLHGPEHRQRRRLENRLFRREVFQRWEREVLPPAFEESFAPFVAAGAGDLLVIGYRTTMNLTARIAGIDRVRGTVDETEQLYAIVKKLSEGATLVHSTRDRAVVRAEVADAMALLDEAFLGPSIARRQELLDSFAAGELAEAELPADVLTTLLRNEDLLELPHDVVLREISFYLQAGAHSTANAFTHAVDEVLTWGDEHPDDLERARGDLGFAQRCVHEAVRLHPASPVAWRRPIEDTELPSGRRLPQGALVVLGVRAANRDPGVFGDNADEFDPWRAAGQVPPWGLSFGAGAHACIGMELDAGLSPGGEPERHVYGTVPLMLQLFLEHGGRRDPADPPTRDPGTQRDHFSRYPVLFGPIR